MTSEQRWCFDPVPPSGARQGGDPAQYVFTPNVSALVREVLQNSNDQLVEGQSCVRVILRSVKFGGEQLRSLKRAIAWSTLGRHLAAVKVASERFGRGVDLMDTDSVAGLWIEDRGTTGLMGEEQGSGNFAALCRDRLFSEKQRVESGGSFGLGKAVLWRFSQISTVAFYSRLAAGDHKGRERFIIKAALPFHEIGRDKYSGDGWFGRVESAGSGDRAVSLWDHEAREAARLLGATLFDKGETGTSICIVGFDDPACDEEDEGDTIEAQLREQARRAFWPALTRKRLSVSVGQSPVEVAGAEDPLATMLRVYDSHGESSALKGADDVVVERITIPLPARKDNTQKAGEVVADVVIQLAGEGSDEWSLSCFRGPGMIVECRKLRRISLSARPFRAILVCGEAVRDNPDQAKALEAFLKTAEPPAHDQWAPTPRLKETYRRGWGVALKSLASTAEDAIRKHVVLPPSTSESGPQRLRQLFRVGTVGGGRAESDFHFRNLSAHLTDGVWCFVASVHPNLPTEMPWHTIIDVEFCEEHGSSRQGGTLALVEVEGAAFELIDGRAHIRAPAGSRGVKIRGETDPGKHPVPTDEAAIELVIRSKVEVSDDD